MFLVSTHNCHLPNSKMSYTSPPSRIAPQVVAATLQASLRAKGSPPSHIILVAFWVNSIAQHCAPAADDRPFIASLRSIVGRVFREKVLLHRYHVVALFLDPLQRPFVVEANVVPLASMVEAEAYTTWR